MKENPVDERQPTDLDKAHLPTLSARATPTGRKKPRTMPDHDLQLERRQAQCHKEQDK
jgi:hypothetical protein